MILRTYIAALAFVSGLLVGADSSADEIESPEIELMRLEFEYACEISEKCKQKNREGKGNNKVKIKEIKEYEAGNKISIKVLGAKGKVKFVDNEKG